MKKLLLVVGVAAVLSACATSSGISDANAVKASSINTELGSAYLSQGDFARANEKLLKALEQNPENADAHSVFALLQMRLGQFDKANTAFKRALRIAPEDSAILNNYGIYLCNQGEPAEALKNFAKALSDPLYPTPEFAYTNAGVCMIQTNDLNKAEAYFKTALNRNPQYAPAVYQMAVVSEKKTQNNIAWNYLMRFYNMGGSQNADNLWLAVRISRALGDRNNEARYSSLLKNKFPDAKQTDRMMRKFN